MKKFGSTLSKALFEHLASEGEEGFTICRAPANSIDIGGMRFGPRDNDIYPQGTFKVPDEDSGYIDFTFSKAFPNFNAYHQACTPGVIAASYASLIDKNLNREHHVQSYDPEKIPDDKILGTVVAVHFPPTPYGGWKITSREDAPAVRAVASFAKAAAGMQKVIGRHMAGRHQYTVSWEISYPYMECAFAVALGDKEKPKFETPDDMVKAGWELIPWAHPDIEDDLLASYSVEKRRIVSDWNGRKVVQLPGGLDKPVRYSGVGMVEYGAESTAQILQMAASRTTDVVEQVLEPLGFLISLAETLKKKC